MFEIFRYNKLHFMIGGKYYVHFPCFAPKMLL